jgi:hypothetical protein
VLSESRDAVLITEEPPYRRVPTSERPRRKKRIHAQVSSG